MMRAAIERPRTLTTWGRHWRGHWFREHRINCVCDAQPGRFRKGQRIGGCGRPHCYLCHGEKLFGRPKLDDLRHRATMRESIAECLT